MMQRNLTYSEYIQTIETKENDQSQLLPEEIELFSCIEEESYSESQIARAKKIIADIKIFPTRKEESLAAYKFAYQFRLPSLDVKNAAGFTPLHKASWYGLTEIVESLLEAKADPDVKTNGGDSSLIFASDYYRTDIVSLLIAAGANTDIQGRFGFTAIGLACVNHDLEIVEALCKAGANLELHNDAKETPLDSAVFTGLYEKPFSPMEFISIIYTLLLHDASIKHPVELFRLLMGCDQRDPQVLFCLNVLCNQEKIHRDSFLSQLSELAMTHHLKYSTKLSKIQKEMTLRTNIPERKLQPILNTYFPRDISTLIQSYAAPSAYSLKFFKPLEIDKVISENKIQDRLCSTMSCLVM